MSMIYIQRLGGTNRADNLVKETEGIMKSRQFRNRPEAGEALAEHLDEYRDDPNAVVLGLARGGLVVAAEISAQLHLPLEVFISRKLRSPEDCECALGAVTETGLTWMDESSLCVQDWLPSELRAYLYRETETQKSEIAHQRRVYRNGLALPDLSGRTIIFVDDGVSSGATFFAAIDSLRQLGVNRIAGAVPVASSGVIRDLHYKLDELVVLLRPESMQAISSYYRDFPQIADEEVAELLSAAHRFKQLGRPA